MPLIDDDDVLVADATVLSFRERVRNGRVVPIVSNEAIFDLALGGHATFVENYARYVKYSLDAPANLVDLVKFHKHRPRAKAFNDQALKFDYLNYVKNHIYRLAKSAGADADLLEEAVAQMDDLSVSEFAGRLGVPAFTGATDPMLILADLPFKTILTTSPFTFAEDALRRAGKRPRTEVCRWRKDLQDSIASIIDDDYDPSAHEPLVYHLLGLDRYADSLVLTEDDYLEYLVNISQAKNNDAIDVIPALVRAALSDELVVLGFSLDSWAFRVLYAGLIKPNSARKEDRGVCNILLPDNPAERSYLEDYMQREAKFEVFWGNMQEYAQGLRQL